MSKAPVPSELRVRSRERSVRARSLSAWGGAALGALGLLGGGPLLSGCGDRQVVLVSVTGRPDPVSGLGIYYSVAPDGGPLRLGGLKPANGVVPNYDLFGISLERSVGGTLSVDVYAHQDGSPCIRSRGHVEVALSGDPKQQTEVTMTPVTGPGCDTQFPGGVFPKNAKIWGSAIDDLWIVGDGGAIVRWNGVYLETLPLPDPLKSAQPRLPNFRAVSGSSARNVWIVGDQGTVLRWNGDSLYWFSQLSDRASMPLRADVQSNIEVTDVWVDPGTRDVTMVGWNPATSSLYFGFASPDGDTALFVNPVEEATSGLAPSGTRDCKAMPTSMFVPRKPLSIACSRAGSGECWVVGERGLVLFHGPRNPTQNYRECSGSVPLTTPPNGAYRAVHVLTDPANFEKYEFFGLGDGGALFNGSREVIVPPNPTYFGPAAPMWTRPPVTFTAAAMARPGVALGGGSGGYLGRISNPGMGYTAMPIALNTTEDISDLAVVRDHLLIVTKGGRLLDVPVP
jgi:hypothetical protein